MESYKSILKHIIPETDWVSKHCDRIKTPHEAMECLHDNDYFLNLIICASLKEEDLFKYYDYILSETETSNDDGYPGGCDNYFLFNQIIKRMRKMRLLDALAYKEYITPKLLRFGIDMINKESMAV
jgi:hypothetical protein